MFPGFCGSGSLSVKISFAHETSPRRSQPARIPSCVKFVLGSLSSALSSFTEAQSNAQSTLGVFVGYE